MIPPCTKSQDGRHNFNPHSGDCLWGCGVNQRGVQKIAPKNPFESVLRPRKVARGIHSELHELVAKLRADFGETATKGKGSFGFYLRMLKPVPLHTIYQWYGSIKDSPKLDTPLAKCKVFWWKFKQWKTGGTPPPQTK